MAVFEVDLRGLHELERHLLRAEHELKDTRDLMEGLAAMLETQTKRRISDEKTAPDGTRWRPWSKEYAATRHSGQALLVDTQSMLDSIAADFTPRGTRVRVGSSMEYAPFVNDDRQFLGLSRENVTELESVVASWLGQVL